MPTNELDSLQDLDKNQDYMEKKSPSFHKSWQKRYFVLDKRVLKYYKTKNDYT